MFRKPRIVVSACLLGDNVRYDGSNAFNRFVLRLSKMWEIIKVCPEVEIGLGVPREKIVVYRDRGILRSFQPETGRDLTWELYEFSNRFLSSLPEVEGFILKSRSPSCGLKGTKTYVDPYGKRFLKRDKGIFAKRVEETFKGIPVIDEVDIESEEKRRRFIEDVIQLWRSRTKVKEDDVVELWKREILG